MTPFVVATVAVTLVVVNLILIVFILALGRAAAKPMPSPLSPIPVVSSLTCGCFLLPSGEVVECGGHFVATMRREGVL